MCYGDVVLVSTVTNGKPVYATVVSGAVKWAPLPPKATVTDLHTGPYVFAVVGGTVGARVSVWNAGGSFCLSPLSKPGQYVCPAVHTGAFSSVTSSPAPCFVPLTLRAVDGEDAESVVRQCQLQATPISTSARHGRTVVVAASLDGPTRVLSVRGGGGPTHAPLVWTAGHAMATDIATFGLTLRLALPCVSVSVVDTNRQVYVS